MTVEMDADLLMWSRSIRAEWLNVLANLDDVLFQPTATFAAALALSIVLWRFGRRWSWCAPIAIVLVSLAEVVLRNGWTRTVHPSGLINGLQVLWGGHYDAAGSFPSGHVARAVFLAVIVLYTLPRWLSVPLGILALTSVPARLYTGAHVLSDVLGGAALGSFVAAATLWAIPILSRQLAQARKGFRPGDAALTETGS